jgi:hypothetical protein
MKKITTILITSVIFSFVLSSLIFNVSHAQYNYTQLESIPGFEDSGSDLKSYVESIYKFAIWTVGIAAVFMITIGGFMYLTSAGNTSKMDVAKKVVTDSIIGLIIALTAYLILYVINPDLININLSMQQVGTATPAPGGTGAPASPKPVSEFKGGGSCGGLSAQSGINSQCGDASPELSKLLACIKSKQPNAVISSISDSQGYTKCINNYSNPPCAHAQYSCHYGGRGCRGKGSYGVDLTTRNLSSSQLKSAAQACGADYALDEGNHVHASVGKQAGCGCN